MSLILAVSLVTHNHQSARVSSALRHQDACVQEVLQMLCEDMEDARCYFVFLTCHSVSSFCPSSLSMLLCSCSFSSHTNQVFLLRFSAWFVCVCMCTPDRHEVNNFLLGKIWSAMSTHCVTNTVMNCTNPETALMCCIFTSF